MAKVSGQGGDAKFGAAGLSQPVAEWEATKTAVLAVVTDSASLSWQRRLAVVKDLAWRCNFPWDNAQLPDVDIAFDAGDEITDLRFYVGPTTGFYSFPAIVETCQVLNNAVSDAVRSVCSGFGNGLVTDPVIA